MTRAVLFLSLAFLAATGCRQNPDCFASDECAGGLACIDSMCVDPALADVNWQMNIQPIVAAKCQTCHGATPANGAPFAIVQYADTQALLAGQPIYERMAARVQDVGRPMPPAGAVMLTQAEINAIVEWVNRGAPSGPTAMGCDGGTCSVGDAGPSPLTGTEVATLVMSGYNRADGPGWNPNNNSVFFVDTGGDQLFQAALPGAPMGFLNLPGGPAGAVADPTGGAIVALSRARQVALVDQTGPQVLADQYMGSALNGPDDVARRSDGTIYFTDPGRELADPRELTFNGLFRIPMGGGAVALEWEGDPAFIPAGLTLGVDETQLYMVDAVDGLIRRFDVAADGALSNESAFVYTRGTAPDGLTVDTMGNVYVASGDGVEVYSPAGGYHGTIPIAGGATNVAFVGNGFSTLYVTSATSVYVVPMSVSGVR